MFTYVIQLFNNRLICNQHDVACTSSYRWRFRYFNIRSIVECNPLMIVCDEHAASIHLRCLLLSMCAAFGSQSTASRIPRCPWFMSFNLWPTCARQRSPLIANRHYIRAAKIIYKHLFINDAVRRHARKKQPNLQGKQQSEIDFLNFWVSYACAIRINWVKVILYKIWLKKTYLKSIFL